MHFENISQFLLLQNGEFEHNLIEELYSTLGKHHSELYNHSLLSQLENVLIQSNTGVENNDYSLGNRPL